MRQTGKTNKMKTPKTLRKAYTVIHKGRSVILATNDSMLWRELTKIGAYSKSKSTLFDTLKGLTIEGELLLDTEKGVFKVQKMK